MKKIFFIFGLLMAFSLSAQDDRKPEFDLNEEQKEVIEKVKTEQEIRKARIKLRKYGFAAISKKGIKASNAIDSLTAIVQTLKDPELVATFQSVIEAAKERPQKGDPAGSWISWISSMLIIVLTSLATISQIIKRSGSGFGLFKKRK